MFSRSRQREKGGYSMLPEFEIELVNATLAELRRQIAADAGASAMQEPGIKGPSLLERFYSLLHFDAKDLPAAERAALRMESPLTR
jgi:hypothetical protein